MTALLAFLLAWLPGVAAPENWETYVATHFGRGQQNYHPATLAEMEQLRQQASSFPPATATRWDNQPTYVVEPPPELGWGLLFCRARRTGWILEVPHPVADRHTATLAWQLFQHCPFDALILGGCHRLNRADGRSDLAHVEESAFMAWHQAMTQQPTIVLQLHGFDANKERAQIMPDNLQFIVADGSGQAPARGPARQLYDGLEQAGWQGSLASPQAPWMLATRNAQREDLQRRGKGFFVHLELDASLRQPALLETTAARLEQVLTPLIQFTDPLQIDSVYPAQRNEFVSSGAEHP